MSPTLFGAFAALGMAVLVVRRRSLAVGLVTIQSLILVSLALKGAAGAQEWIAAGALAARSLGLATFFLWLIARTRDPRLVRAGAGPMVRAGLGATLALALTWLVPTFGLASRDAERVVLALVAFGLVIAATRRATLFQILGVVLVENGLVLGALELPATSWLIEIGVAVDLTLIALVAGVFHDRIFAEFGSGDTEALRSLSD
ncbi:MAG: hypothetical protein ACM30G_11560 [Micromonosporaceae bacterium]